LPRPSPHLTAVSFLRRGDVVRIETWFHPDGRIGAARNWVMRNAETGEVFGRSTRYPHPLALLMVTLCNLLLPREGQPELGLSVRLPSRGVEIRPAWRFILLMRPSALKSHTAFSGVEAQCAGTFRASSSKASVVMASCIMFSLTCVLRSTWVMLNTEKRRAVRIPDEMRVKLYAYTPQPLRWVL